MSNLRPMCFVSALAALTSLSFTPAPSVPATDSMDAWTAGAAQSPQGPLAQKKADDDASFVGLDDLAMASWPGLATVSGLGSLSSPLLGGPPPGGTKPTPVADRLPPKIPQGPSIPAGRVMPTAPVEPLSQYMP